MTDEGYESWRRGQCQGDEDVGDQAIKNETVIKGEIEIVIGDQVYDRDQVGVDHNKRSRPERCVPHHVIGDQQGDSDRGCDRDWDQRSGA